ncbi:hypothetical protein [Mesorhizobium sp. SP-1A]|uniref:hypothetical protein n=1 Tax=Mesorhizobium sp. SP-1A TaxID=3077840 RepID=UPI0028F6EE28|nr:hypothetical protein [Mesorhizobium sp. SP-1A]
MVPTSKTQQSHPTIGGHFSLFLTEGKTEPLYRQGYESARSALYALLCELKPTRVYVPNYICDAVSAALSKAQCNAEPYNLNKDFLPTERIILKEYEILILVNYFGLCERYIKNHINKENNQKIIVDNSQAYYQNPFDCLANIYSPRKFVPVADGGFISTTLNLPFSPSDEEASLARAKYLLKRVAREPESSRQDYLDAERSLQTPGLRAMSSLSRNLISAADHSSIISRRRANFVALESLSEMNMLKFDLGDQVPLCYPLCVEGGLRLRQHLIDRRIFTPHYWPGVTPKNDFEAKLLDQTVFIPVDHRYDSGHMRYIADTILSLVEGESQ